MSTSPKPVLLVHGFLDRRTVFRPLTRLLKHEGCEVYALDLQPNDGRRSIPGLALQVASFVENNIESHTFDLVGFSMGGIVSRFYLQRLGGHGRVRHFVNVSAPNRGTYLAYGLPFPGIRQMRPGSPLLQDLNRTLSQDLQDVKVTWLWTPYDLMIFPASSCQLPIGHGIKLPVLLHHWMLRDQRSLKAIAGTLLA